MQSSALLIKVLSLAPILFTFAPTANAQSQYRGARSARVGAINFDMSRVERVWVSPGLATVIRFPCDISEAVIGRGEDLKAQVSPTTKRILSLYLTKMTSQATNLLVKCEISDNLFVFDVLPSMTRHQDFLKVNSGFNGPVLQTRMAKRLEMEDGEDERLLAVISKKQTLRSLRASTGSFVTELPEKQGSQKGDAE